MFRLKRGIEFRAGPAQTPIPAEPRLCFAFPRGPGPDPRVPAEHRRQRSRGGGGAVQPPCSAPPAAPHRRRGLIPAPPLRSHKRGTPRAAAASLFGAGGSSDTRGNRRFPGAAAVGGPRSRSAPAGPPRSGADAPRDVETPPVPPRGAGAAAARGAAGQVGRASRGPAPRAPRAPGPPGLRGSRRGARPSGGGQRVRGRRARAAKLSAGRGHRSLLRSPRGCWGPRPLRDGHRRFSAASPAAGEHDGVPAAGPLRAGGVPAAGPSGGAAAPPSPPPTPLRRADPAGPGRGSIGGGRRGGAGGRGGGAGAGSGPRRLVASRVAEPPRPRPRGRHVPGREGDAKGNVAQAARAGGSAWAAGGEVASGSVKISPKLKVL